jgi:uncharacterized protein DUF7009
VKLRIHENSLRLRLSRSDLEQFRQKGVCTESLQFGSNSQLSYALEASSQVAAMAAQFREDCISILLPLDLAQAWAGSDQVSLSLNPGEGGGPSLLIEKDFQCLHRVEPNPSEDTDSFPNPKSVIGA